MVLNRFKNVLVLKINMIERGRKFYVLMGFIAYARSAGDQFEFAQHLLTNGRQIVTSEREGISKTNREKKRLSLRMFT